MDIASLVLAVLAFGLSCFTFYWTSLRTRRALTLIVDSPLGSFAPHVVIANGSTFDIFVVSLVCTYITNSGNAHIYLNQKCDSLAAGGALIPAGKALPCHIAFTERMPDHTLAIGRISPNVSPPIRMFDVAVQIRWIEPSGREYQAECLFGEHGFSDKGYVTMGHDRRRRFDLYTENQEIQPGSRPTMP